MRVLSDDQLKRYSRHIILKDVGVSGQEKIMNAKVLLIGLGGLGAPAALYLAAAGVGTLGLVDGDSVEMSNLQRQIIHFMPDIKKPKVQSAREKIAAINPEVTVLTYHERLYANTIMKLITEYDFIIDGTDNFPAKFLINDACVRARKPYSHGGILRFEGQTMTYLPGETCYRCIFGGPPPKDAVPSCAQAGILGAVAGMLGTIQATEALKYITNTGALLVNQLLIFDARTMDFRKVPFTRNPQCPLCGEYPTITQLVDEEEASCDVRHAKKQTLGEDA